MKRKGGRRKRGRRNAQERAVVKKRVGVVVVWGIHASVNPFSPLGITHAHTEGARDLSSSWTTRSRKAIIDRIVVCVCACVRVCVAVAVAACVERDEETSGELSYHGKKTRKRPKKRRASEAPGNTHAHARIQLRSCKRVVSYGHAPGKKGEHRALSKACRCSFLP